MTDFGTEELIEIVDSLKTALKRAAANGGVTEYTIKSGQGETRVKQATITEITEQLAYYRRLLAEAQELQDGSAISYFVNMGL